MTPQQQLEAQRLQAQQQAFLEWQARTSENQTEVTEVKPRNILPFQKKQVEPFSRTWWLYTGLIVIACGLFAWIVSEWIMADNEEEDEESTGNSTGRVGTNRNSSGSSNAGNRIVTRSNTGGGTQQTQRRVSAQVHQNQNRGQQSQGSSNGNSGSGANSSNGQNQQQQQPPIGDGVDNGAGDSSGEGETE